MIVKAEFRRNLCGHNTGVRWIPSITMALFPALMIERDGRDAAIFFIVAADSIVCLAERILAE
jgi:hypothetical protein